MNKPISNADFTYTRADLAEEIYADLGISFAESSDIVDKTFNVITDALESGNNVKLSSFGTFEVIKKEARVGRNPKTKVEVTISPRKVIRFRPSKILTEAANKKNGS